MPNLYEQLPLLIELQSLDEQLRHLEAQCQVFPRQQKKLEAQLSRRREEQEGRNEEQKELQLEHRSKATIVEGNQQKIQKYRGQLLQAKTNREYAALESEISHLEDENTLIEDDILKTLLRMDEVKAEMVEASEVFRKYEAAFAKKKAELEAELESLNHQIKTTRKEREAVYGSPDMDQELRDRYDKWMVRKHTTLVAPVSTNTCGACHITLRPQVVNLLHQRNDLLTCNSCGRVLYLVPAEETTNESEPA